ncbi:RNA-binding domain-containing protein [Linderina pennispora]|uniref:RNA-binding domain-containing protein n=1 Tax=Linderina pennispora TaxID=61395 RepID=A0A1Y1WCQ9_9FUNG|nr:RNA-binding domain-containing protein [Linderina pennispora]ORX71319.1 RNA-binding domain-containing protein [Linderina pennispora]
MSDLADKHIDEYADHVDPDAYEDPEHYEEGHGDDADDADDADGLDDDPELAALKKQMEEMEKEAQRLRELQEKMTAEAEAEKSEEAAADDVDARSIYVGNVDYASTPEGLQEHFKGSGTINRVTILCDKFTGHPKGYAYVEFATTDAVTKAQILDGSMFHGRPLKVNPKRTNVPGMHRGRGRGRGRGGYMPRGRGYGGYRGRGRGAYYSPY